MICSVCGNMIITGELVCRQCGRGVKGVGQFPKTHTSVIATPSVSQGDLQTKMNPNIAPSPKDFSSETIFCWRCGIVNENSRLFCYHCGAIMHHNIAIKNNPTVRSSNAYGIAGLITAILGVLLCSLPGLSLALSLMGLCFSIAGQKEAARGIAVAGLILSIIGMALGSIMFIACFSMGTNNYFRFFAS